MGFDDCSLFGEQTACFISSAIGQVGCSAEQVSHAIGKLSEACSSYSHVEGSDRLSVRQSIRPSTIICASIVRKPLVKIDRIKNATLTFDNTKIDWDVLERNFGPLNKGDIVFHK